MREEVSSGRKWIAPLERIAKLGVGAHQGQSGWSRTTGATDLPSQRAAKEAPDLEWKFLGFLDFSFANLGIFVWNLRRPTEVYRAFTEVYGGFRKLRQMSMGVYRAFTEVGGGFITKASQRCFTEVRRIIQSLKRKNFQRGYLCALRRHNFRLHLKGQDTGQDQWETGSAPVQEAAGEISRRVVCVHLDGTTQPEWGGYSGDTKEKGSDCTSEVWLRIREDFVFVFKSRKNLDQLGPVGEEELMFDGKGFHQFLDLFEMAGENEGAEDYDKVKQVIFFCKGRDLKEEVMEMECWRELDWGKLVKEMKARWGRYRPAPRYTIQELWTAFSYFFDTRLKYLEKEETFLNNNDPEYLAAPEITASNWTPAAYVPARKQKTKTKNKKLGIVREPRMSRPSSPEIPAQSGMTREEKATFMENLSHPQMDKDTQMNLPSPAPEQPTAPVMLPISVDQEVSNIVNSIQPPPHYLPPTPDTPAMGPETKMVLNAYQQNFKDYQTAVKEENNMLEIMYLHQCLSNHITLERMIGTEQLELLKIPINPRKVLEEKKKGKKKEKETQESFQAPQGSSKDQGIEAKPLPKSQFRKQKKNHMRQNKRNLADFLQVTKQIMRNKN
ncbi:hypothetical protein BY996DRAFT_6609934 [Phakopsora pachyrhizi]|nr:hypothetical protein BY996DRAFT_6609934 [Phakopsora pachyrhizi]